MKLNGEHIHGNGHCLVCGIRLASGEICFDCMNPSESKAETLKRIIEIQDRKLSFGEKLELEPVEDEDYYVQHEVLAQVEASGMIWAFVGEDMDDGEVLENFQNDGGDLNKIVDDLDIHIVENTGRTRLVTPDGKPFKKDEWLKNKLSRTKRKNGYKATTQINLMQAVSGN